MTPNPPVCSVPNARFDTTDPGGTYRPDVAPSPSKGTQFKPLTNMEPRDAVLVDVPNDPLSLFLKFVPETLMEEWVNTTNSSVDDLLSTNEHSDQARIASWTPTSVPEVYTFIAMILSMENHPETSIVNYWKFSADDDTRPIHSFTRHMSLRRFQVLFRRLHVFKDGDVMPLAFGPDLDGPRLKAYRQVETWSQHIQQTMLEVYIPGSHVAVDECMVEFTGRSSLKTHIPNKPTPDGIKVWVVAEKGIFLRWLRHVPNSGPIGIPPKRKNDDGILRITPTQQVVISLLKLLPPAKYHVYLDNLFSSPDLFKYLYDIDIGASGTTRVNSGINVEIANAKTKGDRSRPWGWTMQVPTACEKVVL